MIGLVARRRFVGRRCCRIVEEEAGKFLEQLEIFQQYQFQEGLEDRKLDKALEQGKFCERELDAQEFQPRILQIRILGRILSWRIIAWGAWGTILWLHIHIVGQLVAILRSETKRLLMVVMIVLGIDCILVLMMPMVMVAS